MKRRMRTVAHRNAPITKTVTTTPLPARSITITTRMAAPITRVTASMWLSLTEDAKAIPTGVTATAMRGTITARWITTVAKGMTITGTAANAITAHSTIAAVMIGMTTTMTIAMTVIAISVTMIAMTIITMIVTIVTETIVMTTTITTATTTMAVVTSNALSRR